MYTQSHDTYFESAAHMSHALSNVLFIYYSCNNTQTHPHILIIYILSIGEEETQGVSYINKITQYHQLNKTKFKNQSQ